MESNLVGVYYSMTKLLDLFDLHWTLTLKVKVKSQFVHFSLFRSFRQSRSKVFIGDR
jgi:hypothetical protein